MKAWYFSSRVLLFLTFFLCSLFNVLFCEMLSEKYINLHPANSRLVLKHSVSHALANLHEILFIEWWNSTMRIRATTEWESNPQPWRLRSNKKYIIPLDSSHRSAEPGSQLVTERWRPDWGWYLATARNFIVAEIDARGSGGQVYVMFFIYVLNKQTQCRVKPLYSMFND